MKNVRARVMKAMVDFFGDDFRRIDHAIEVLKETERIMETRSDYDTDILYACALLHDVGIKPSEEKFGYNNGKTQEELGPPEADNLLKTIGFPEEKIAVVTDIIGNHHSPSRFDFPELEILKEADRIVNKAGK